MSDEAPDFLHEHTDLARDLSLFDIFFLYSRRRVRETTIERETRLVTEERAAVERGYQVLVPIADPDHARDLIRVGAAVARARDGELLLTTVVTIPDQTPLDVGRRFVGNEREMLETAMEHVPDDVPAHYTVTIGHKVGRNINNVAYQRESDLVLVGWRGRRRRGTDRVLGDTIDQVVEEAPCDVAVLKLDGDEAPRRVLVPTGGGPHSELAVDVAGAFMAADEHTRVTLMTVTTGPPEEARERLSEQGERLVETAGTDAAGERVDFEVVPDGEIAEHILDFAEAENVDTIVIGATREGRVRQALIGAIPETVGEGFPGRVLMVKKHRPLRGALEAWWARWFGGRDDERV